MKNIDELTLGEIVKRNYRAAAVLDRYGLDYCCNGNQTLEKACDTAKIDAQVVRGELDVVETATPEPSTDFDAWPLHKLIDYIKERHHAYVEKTTPRINGYLEKVCSVHGDRHPELHQIRRIFDEVGGELAVHMKKEELMLFPFIKKIETARPDAPAASPVFVSVASPINMMMADHADEGEKLREIAALTNNYTVPDDGCNTYALTYQLLNEFENDLHLHIHLENNILFPKAVAMEEAAATR